VHSITDQPDWSNDQLLAREFPLGWGDAASGFTPPKFLDPGEEHNWYSLPEDYSWHRETLSWAVRPQATSDAALLGLARDRAR